eukprot:3496834-Rhodomonas_salina.1
MPGTTDSAGQYRDEPPVPERQYHSRHGTRASKQTTTEYGARSTGGVQVDALVVGGVVLEDLRCHVPQRPCLPRHLLERGDQAGRGGGRERGGRRGRGEVRGREGRMEERKQRGEQRRTKQASSQARLTPSAPHRVSSASIQVGLTAHSAHPLPPSLSWPR